MDVNLNNTACLVKKNNFTETVITNVCTGAVTNVPHGTVDYLGSIMVGIVLIMFISMLVRFLITEEY